ncbi:MAG: hypothetical protein GXY25_23505, partial [Pirellulaceae bacterium]|nr:hypothetical protein [Pirellulaceae bacterium]
MRLSKPFAQSARWRCVLLGVLVAFCAAAIVGCGGSDPPPAAPAGSPDAAGQAGGPGAAEPASPPADAAPSEPAEATEPVEAEPAEAEPAKPAAEPAESAAADAASAAAADAPVEEKGRQLPEDIASWQEVDYLAAKQARDPRLLDAVAYFGEQYSGDATAARLLATLLTTPEEPEPEPKPEPKVEKKPEKRSPSDFGEFGPMESFPEGGAAAMPMD